MTGESMPVEKFPAQQDTAMNNALELENIVFMGTNVVSGSAHCCGGEVQTYRLILVLLAHLSLPQIVVQPLFSNGCK